MTTTFREWRLVYFVAGTTSRRVRYFKTREAAVAAGLAMERKPGKANRVESCREPGCGYKWEINCYV
jgi:hypothetical protein